MDNHYISVLMPCYREPKRYIRKAIDSVLSQTYTKWELILLLDDPNNKELIAVCNEYKKRDKRIKFYINEKNMGIVSSLNNGLLYAKGDVIARLDADDIALENRFSEQVKFIDDYDVVSSNFAFINTEDEIIRHRVFPEKHNDIVHYLVNIADCMYHTTWMVRKEVYESLRGYRAIGPFEDYDFLLRAVNAKYKMYNCPYELSLYRVNPSGISSTNKVLQHLGSEYLRENFRRINEITNNEILEYIKSEQGLYRSKEYIKFYTVTSKLYNAKNIIDYYIKLFVYGPYLAFFTYYGRKKILLNFLNRRI